MIMAAEEERHNVERNTAIEVTAERETGIFLPDRKSVRRYVRERRKPEPKYADESDRDAREFRFDFKDVELVFTGQRFMVAHVHPPNPLTGCD